MRCPYCGSEFLQAPGGTCPACGRLLARNADNGSAQSSDEMRARVTRIWWQSLTEGTDPGVQVAAQVSTAINTRRIALTLLLFVILFIVTLLVELMISLLQLDSAGSRLLLGLWAVVAVAILVYGVYFIIRRKGLTRL